MFIAVKTQFKEKFIDWYSLCDRKNFVCGTSISDFVCVCSFLFYGALRGIKSTVCVPDHNNALNSNKTAWKIK